MSTNNHVPGRRHINLCLQAETDIITTDEDINMEDQILMLYLSQVLCVSTCFCFFSCHSIPSLVYTLISFYATLAIDIRDNTGTVIYAHVGLRP